MRGIGYHRRLSPLGSVVSTPSAPPAATRRRSALVWSLAALFVGLILSVLLAREHARLLHQQDEAELQLALERISDDIADQLQACGVLIRALQTLLAASAEPSQAQFEAFYANLQPKQSFPALIAIGYSPVQREADGEHHRIRLVVPLVGNERLIGLDVVSQPVNLVGLQLSRDSNEPALSASFRLIQRSGMDEPIDGVTLRLPVYRDGGVPATLDERREHFVGSIGISFRVSQLIANALPRDVDSAWGLRVLDVEQGLPQVLHVNASATPDDLERHAAKRELRYGGRRWRVEVQAPQGRVRATDWIPWVTFGSGALASLLLASWLWTLGRTRERALQLAERLSARYRDSEARFRALNELLPAAVLLAEVDSGHIVHVNQFGRRLLGLDQGHTGQRRLAQLFEDEAFALQLAGSPSSEPAGALVTRLLSPEGPFWASVALARIELDAQEHLLAVISDISEFRELTDRLGYQASHDALTELYNRREFERRLELAAQRESGSNGALLYLDLDQFKLINDTSGHMAGDQLLAGLGAVLKHAMDEQDVLARLGGDEFGILLAQATSESALQLAERLRRAIDDFSFAWEGRTFALTVSIGIVMIEPRSGRSLRELLSLADTACYVAKERGRNRIHLFSDHDLETTRRRGEMEWASRLRQALNENRCSLHYQMIQPLRATRESVGMHFELLLRLRDEQGQMVPPGAFVPAAERYHLMPQVDRWVLQTALANFDRLLPEGQTVGLCSINLSGNTLEDEHFPDFVIEQLRRHQVPAERLCFEITETAAVGNMARVAHFIQRLRKLGCRFALDDFGVGMSSFGYLKNLPVDFIKIDGSFIRELETDAMSYSIVRAVTDIGHQVGVEVVAEFVGHARTIELLRGLGVDYAQGYAVHTPEPTGADPHESRRAGPRLAERLAETDRFAPQS